MLDELETAFAGVAKDRAGVRLHGQPSLRVLLAADTAIGRVASGVVGAAAMPVRAILFDKTPGTNWALGWHQDRIVAVAERHAVLGWGPWSVKAGIHHVEPPFDVIEHSVTLRIHFDPVPADNAPLLIAPGSHLLGRIAERDVAVVAQRCGTAMCLAERGDVWAYAASILHASTASAGHGRRRVLQVDYAAAPLPSPFQWLGV